MRGAFMVLGSVLVLCLVGAALPVRVSVTGVEGRDRAAAAPGSVEGAQVPEGATLVSRLGCGGCHGGVPFDGGIRQVAPPLGSDSVPLAPAYVFRYLADPQPVRPDIGPARMPRFDLDEGERLALALFVTNEVELVGVDDTFEGARARHPEVDRARGRELFDAFGCAGCHVHAEQAPTPRAPDLSIEGARVRGDWLRSYLSIPGTIRPAGPHPGVGGRMPDFDFTPGEVEAVASYLETLGRDAVPEWTPEALSPFSMQKAETLLRSRWSCLGCHQLGDEGGRIGPRLDGLAERLQPSFVRAFIEDPAHLAPGTVMPGSLEQDDRLDLVASFLVRQGGAWQTGERMEGLPAVEMAGEGGSSGEALYQRTCAPCHGRRGEGDGFNAPYLPVAPTRHANAEAMSLRPDDTLYDGIHAGGWILGKSHRMPAFGASLEPEQIRSLVAYIRELCECQGPLWSRDGRPGS